MLRHRSGLEQRHRAALRAQRVLCSHSNITKPSLILLNKVNSQFLHRPEHKFLQSPLKEAPGLRVKLYPGDEEEPATLCMTWNKPTPESTTPHRISLGLCWKGPQRPTEMLSQPCKLLPALGTPVRLHGSGHRLARVPHPAEGSRTPKFHGINKAPATAGSRRKSPSSTDLDGD